MTINPYLRVKYKCNETYCIETQNNKRNDKVCIVYSCEETHKQSTTQE